jgi:two-component sensor histidine kinase
MLKKIMFQIPKTSCTDFYDVARFLLTWKITAILVVCLLSISCYFFFVDCTTALFYLAGFVIALMGFVHLNLFSNYKVVAITLICSGELIVFTSMFIVTNSAHFIDTVWLFILILYSSFTLNKIWGITILIINALGLSLFLIFALNINIENLEPYTLKHQFGLILELVLGIFMIGYILYHFIETMARAERKIKLSNEELKRKNKKVEFQHEEKTFLLQEIHHRVKNNLQVISSLLRLQLEEIESPQTRIYFLDAINRVSTMALIHQKMYRENDLSKINTFDYFNTLIGDLILSNSTDIPIEIDIKTELDRVGTKTIVPLALLINELVSNSLKHAFVESGIVRVKIASESDGYFRLEYSDNGIWKVPNNLNSFGLELLDTLTEQLDGNWSRSVKEEGTFYTFNLANLDR